MQKFGLTQVQKGKLTPQQAQFIKLLQVPSEALYARVQAEIEANPTLEEEKSGEASASVEEGEYMSAGGVRRKSHSPTRVSEEMLKSKLGMLQPSWHERLLAQLSLLPLDERAALIARYLIGSLSADGYLRTHVEVVAQNLSLMHYIEADSEEIIRVLRQVQTLDPPGIGARDLQECLLLQLARMRKTPAVKLAIQVLTHCFDAFSNKNYEKIVTTLDIHDQELLKRAIKQIVHLTPQPISARAQEEVQIRQNPDFIVKKGSDDQLTVSLYRDYLPSLRIRRHYRNLLQRYERKRDSKAVEVTRFVKKNIQRAQWFIEAIQQRRQTLLRTMEAILELQRPFFVQQDEQQLRPLFMRHVAEKIGMDISTVSRVVSGKSVVTDFGTYPLKYFFSEAIDRVDGTQVSSRTIKSTLQSLIDTEDKQHPYTDEQLVAFMQKKGYQLARRTVAKYRAQMDIPVARMRRELI